MKNFLTARINPPTKGIPALICKLGLATALAGMSIVLLTGLYYTPNIIREGLAYKPPPFTDDVIGCGIAMMAVGTVLAYGMYLYANIRPPRNHPPNPMPK